ncbi:MAG: bifunctional nuclease family protein [Desulfatibacillum sp.]|nr:bifunctional nuclease family protein [Desulfatibacillum sp.]
MLHEMEVAGLALDPSNNTPILVLKSLDGEQTLPIWIGLLEAASIAMALQNVEFSRPMTHDLFKNFVDTLEISVARVEVVDLQESTFFARIYFNAESGAFSLDARPSDAIAIALRTKSPIFAEEAVITKSTAAGPAVAEDDSEEGKKWAEYLEKLNPDDFGKYKM